MAKSSFSPMRCGPPMNCATFGMIISLARMKTLSSIRRVAEQMKPNGDSTNSSAGMIPKYGANCAPLTMTWRNALWIGSAAFSLTCTQLHGSSSFNGIRRLPSG
jgi:hypothetical protein